MSKLRGPKLPPGQAADITLILEGTYPFVSGGVSSWVHQIIKGLPELRFSLVFIGGSPDKHEKMRFELPPNVVHLQEHYLSEVPTQQRVVSRRGDAAFYAASTKLHDLSPGRRDPSNRGRCERAASVTPPGPTMIAATTQASCFSGGGSGLGGGF